MQLQCGLIRFSTAREDTPSFMAISAAVTLGFSLIAEMIALFFSELFSEPEPFFSEPMALFSIHRHQRVPIAVLRVFPIYKIGHHSAESSQTASVSTIVQAALIRHSHHNQPRYFMGMLHLSLPNLNPNLLHRYSPYSGSCRCHPCHLPMQGRIHAYCRNRDFFESETRMMGRE